MPIIDSTLCYVAGGGRGWLKGACRSVHSVCDQKTDMEAKQLLTAKTRASNIFAPLLTAKTRTNGPQTFLPPISLSVAYKSFCIVFFGSNSFCGKPFTAFTSLADPIQPTTRKVQILSAPIL
jgi:hypothetical protein